MKILIKLFLYKNGGKLYIKLSLYKNVLGVFYLEKI